jgi:glyoxylase-like metal-dependent hydrolase (beta-lactamase superfamily II)
MATVEISTYLSGYKPIPAAVAGWDDARPATWPATTASLVSSNGHAVLVDALMTVREGEALAGWVAAAGAGLDAVYVTHAHADHFFGATSLLRAVPTARLLTRAEIVEAAAVQTAPGYLRVWNGFFPAQLAEHPRVPEAAGSDLLLGESPVVRAVLVGQSDVEVSSVVHVPDLDVVLSGDVVYNGIHLWLAGSTPATRSAWLAALDAVEQLAPRTIVAGHRDPAAADGDAARLLDQTRSYLADFDQAAATADDSAELVAAMLDRYGSFGNEYTLWVAAGSQFAA